MIVPAPDDDDAFARVFIGGRRLKFRRVVKVRRR